MNRVVSVLAFCAVSLCAGAVALPQSAAPTPNAANTYSDDAMSFTAPSDFARVPMPAASDDPGYAQGPRLVAAFVKNPGRDGQHTIAIQVEPYDGNLNAYESHMESQLRQQGEEVFFHGRKLTQLSNGMPAVWEQVYTGSDMNETVRYEYIWVDGVRAVVLAEAARFGELDEQTALRDLANASAVAYPRRGF